MGIDNGQEIENLNSYTQGFVKGSVLILVSFFTYLKTSNDKKTLIMVKDLIDKRLEELEKNGK